MRLEQSSNIRSELKSLRAVMAKSALSILVKTRRTHPATAQDPIALKNTLTEA